LVDEECEGNADYYAAEEKEHHFACVWFVEVNYCFVFLHVLCLSSLLFADGQKLVVSSYVGSGLKVFVWSGVLPQVHVYLICLGMFTIRF
jgi:hypothetical protein